jgi:methionyl-tRNA formyltransferase
VGARAVTEALPRFMSGAAMPSPQDGARATSAPMLKKEDGLVDFAKPARAVHDHVRGMTPWPGAHARIGGRNVKLLATRVASVVPPAGVEPGQVILADKTRLVVACGEGAVELVRVQLEGKKPMRGADWVIGRGVKEGDRFG